MKQEAHIIIFDLILGTSQSRLTASLPPDNLDTGDRRSQKPALMKMGVRSINP
jgi:hypothetical protein